MSEVKLQEKKKKRDYQNQYPSVSQILGVLRKPALENWFMKNTAEFCRLESAKGKLCGTQIHECIQQYIETQKASIDTEYEIEVTNALKSFILFTKENPDIKLKRSEIGLTDEVYGFNGTVDATAEIGGKAILLDWKSGKVGKEQQPPIFPEFLYQCSAYCYLMKLDEAIIVAISKDAVSYSMRPMFKDEINRCFSEVFIPCLKIFNYTHPKKES